MIIAQVCLRLATIKGHSKICSFITPHNATDVASFEGACNWHADYRNPHQPRTSTSSIFTSKIVWDQPPGQLLQQSVCITKEFLHKLSAHLYARRPHRGLDLTAVRRRYRLEWANAHWRLALWRGVLFTDESQFSLYRADGRQRVWRRVGWAVCWCQRCGSSGPWWRWGYGMGRLMLWTTNTGAFYWLHFECTEIPWRDPEAHCCAIHPRPSPHVAAW